MDICLLNDLLKYSSIPFVVSALLPTSGQRRAYLGSFEQTKPAVLKITSTNESVVARIQREIRILSSLDSKYFPKVYHFAYVTKENIADYIDHLIQDKCTDIPTVSPFFYTVEEYVENIGWEKALPVIRGEAEFIGFMSRMFEALALLWEKHVVHRDIKPDNILITASMEPVIIDLGIARSFQAGTKDLTAMFFQTPCTPQFAAPEQLLNKRDEITYKSDQFAMGVTAFYLLTGKFPYGSMEEDGVDVVLRNMHEGRLDSFDSVPFINKDLFEFVLRLLAVQPFQRFRTSQDINTALAAIRGMRP